MDLLLYELDVFDLFALHPFIPNYYYLDVDLGLPFLNFFLAEKNEISFLFFRNVAPLLSI